MSRKPIYYFIFQDKTAFMPLQYLYPECSVLIEDHTRVEPLQCFRTSCPANKNCAEILAKRVNYLFTEVLKGPEVLFAYFKFRGEGFYRNGEFVPSLGAVLFDRELGEPKWLKINRWGFNKCKNEGTTMAWFPTNEFLFMGGSKGLIVL